jgi:hypothetical protein
MQHTSLDHPFKSRKGGLVALLITSAVPVILTTLKRHISGLPGSMTSIGFFGPVWIARKTARILRSSTQYDDNRANHMASAFCLCFLALVGTVLALSILTWTSPFSMKVIGISMILYADGMYSHFVIPNWRDFRRLISMGNPSQILSAAVSGVFVTVVLAQGLLLYLLTFYSRISSLYANS